MVTVSGNNTLGQRESYAARQRRHTQERAEVIAALGMPAEDTSSYATRYACTTGEFIRDLRIEKGDAEAVRLCPWLERLIG